MNNTPTLGSILKEARLSRGLSLRDVERATKGRLSNGHLSLLESDQVQQPSPHHLHLLATILTLEYADLLKCAGYVVPGAAVLPRVSEASNFLRKVSELSPGERRELEDYVEYIRSKRAKGRK